MNVLSNNKLKSLAAYKQQKNCDSDGVFVVEGVKMAQEALKSGWHIRTICSTEEALGAIGAVGDNVSDGLYVASKEQLERLSLLRSPQGVWILVERMAECRRPDAGVREVERREESPLVLALDGIQDPGNMGTILRTCDWFGVREVLCSADTVSCYNPKVVQATMGAIFRTRVGYCNLAERIASYKEHGYTVYGAMLDGDDAFKTAIKKPSLLVIGNEGHGISPEVAAVVDRKLTIPNIGGTCESLNAAVATAILVSRLFYISL